MRSQRRRMVFITLRLAGLQDTDQFSFIPTDQIHLFNNNMYFGSILKAATGPLLVSSFIPEVTAVPARNIFKRRSTVTSVTPQCQTLLAGQVPTEATVCLSVLNNNLIVQYSTSTDITYDDVHVYIVNGIRKLSQQTDDSLNRFSTKQRRSIAVFINATCSSHPKIRALPRNFHQFPCCKSRESVSESCLPKPRRCS
jgi:hypothetical protein